MLGNKNSKNPSMTAAEFATYKLSFEIATLQRGSYYKIVILQTRTLSAAVERYI